MEENPTLKQVLCEVGASYQTYSVDFNFNFSFLSWWKLLINYITYNSI